MRYAIPVARRAGMNRDSSLTSGATAKATTVASTAISTMCATCVRSQKTPTSTPSHARMTSGTRSARTSRESLAARTDMRATIARLRGGGDPLVHRHDGVRRLGEAHVVAHEVGLKAVVLPHRDEVVGAGDDGAADDRVHAKPGGRAERGRAARQLDEADVLRA